MVDYIYPANDIIMRLNELDQSAICECFNFGKLNRTFEFDKIGEPDKHYREKKFTRNEVELLAECFNHEFVLSFVHLREVKEHEAVTEEFTKEFLSCVNECVNWVSGLFKEVTVVKFAHSHLADK
jgi:hypothetical protein